MHQNIQSDEALVDRTRQLLTKRRRMRWVFLLYGLGFIGFCVYATAAVVQRLDRQDSVQMTTGFFTGIVLALLCTTCGVLGAVFLAQALSGFHSGTRMPELLLRYHDRLRDLGALPDGTKGAAPNGGPAPRVGNSGVTKGPPSVS